MRLLLIRLLYLKANYPAEYMASVMSNNINNTDAITMFMEDCKSMGVDVLGPDVNESQYKFSVNEKGRSVLDWEQSKELVKDRVNVLQEKERTEDLKIFTIFSKE